MRIIEGDAFAKVKSYTDEKGKTVRKLALDYGGKRGSDEVIFIREKWAEDTNNFLLKAGINEKIDHRTLENQGIDREPTFHLGHEVTAMQRKGIITQVGERLKTLLHINEAMEIAKTIAQNIKDVPNEIFHRYTAYTNYMKDMEKQNNNDKGYQR